MNPPPSPLFVEMRGEENQLKRVEVGCYKGEKKTHEWLITEPIV